jgi:hypothetical protein
MTRVAVQPSETAEPDLVGIPAGTDLVEWYFEQGWTDGLPVVPPTRGRIAAFVAALGGEPDFVECKVPPRHGSLSREVLAINMAMAGCNRANATIGRAVRLVLLNVGGGRPGDLDKSTLGHPGKYT